MDTLGRTTPTLGALACVLALAPLTPAQASACTRVAAPGGSDSAAGTAGAPYATFKKLVHSLAPGQTGCLRAGHLQGERRGQRKRRAGCADHDPELPGRAGDVPRAAHDRPDQLLPDLPEHDLRRVRRAERRRRRAAAEPHGPRREHRVHRQRGHQPPHRDLLRGRQRVPMAAPRASSSAATGSTTAAGCRPPTTSTASTCTLRAARR